MKDYSENAYRAQRKWRFPPLTPCVKGMLIAIGAGFLMSFFAAQYSEGDARRYFVMQPALFWGSGWYWLPLTAVFVYFNIGNAIMNATVLFIEGYRLESVLGPVKFLGFFIGNGVLGNLLFAFLASSSHAGMEGISAGNAALLGCAMVLSRGSEYRFWGLAPVKAWIIQGILLVILIWNACQYIGTLWSAVSLLVPFILGVLMIRRIRRNMYGKSKRRKSQTAGGTASRFENLEFPT
ncbi:rhomboid family intramembrane serine protease [bacterium]|nr:rhomboid family intramembrane serine protease [candidate division CSSED10-310 bacterium]